MNTLTVDLGERSYPIYIGPGLLEELACFKPHIPGSRVVVITNEKVGPLYLARTMATLKDYRPESIVLPDGEEFKSLAVLEDIFDHLLHKRCDRKTTLVALGGGVIGDISGFAAACYQRGVPFLQIPTTLLAQVDSSVGGKTAVNHPLGKNMIGAFYQPVCVVADTQVLDTLEDRQLRSGLAEVIKYGLIRDPDFFEWLEIALDALLQRDPKALTEAIARSCQNKAQVVAADEFEKGQRALLNLGHTFGHAIETDAGYGNWLHGEAVAAGTCMAAKLSVQLGWLSEPAFARIEQIFQRAQLPIAPPKNMDSRRFLEIMALDKKVQNDRIHLVLLKGIGQSVVTGELSQDALASYIDSAYA